jgi:hypothetical protein
MIAREPGIPRMNIRDLPMVAVMGQIAHPVGRPSPYRVGHDGIPRILPGTGGIVVNFRIGDRCVGLAGDHIEPGAALHNNSREIIGEKNGPNLALLTYACVGNLAQVVTGPSKGKQGVVSGKHGGVEHILVDFPTSVLRRLRIGDRIQVYSYGLGLRLRDHPGVSVFNCSPRLVRRWGMRSRQGKLQVPVTHLIPAAIMGSGIGRDNVIRGDYDIQLFDPDIRRRFRLESLRFGDFVAIIHSDNKSGRAYRRGSITIGVVVHGDSTVSGHGPGVSTLLTAEGRYMEPLRDPNANLAMVLGLRKLPSARSYPPLIRAKRIADFTPLRKYSWGKNLDGERLLRIGAPRPQLFPP